MSNEQVPPGSPAPPPPPPPAPPPPPPPGGEPSNRTLLLIAAYLGPLALIPFLLETEDQEIRWHARHGLVLLGAEIVLALILGIFKLVMVAIFPPLGCLVVLLIALLALGVTIFHVACIVKAINGQRLTVPGLSELADRF